MSQGIDLHKCKIRRSMMFQCTTIGFDVVVQSSPFGVGAIVFYLPFQRPQRGLMDPLGLLRLRTHKAFLTFATSELTSISSSFESKFCKFNNNIRLSSPLKLLPIIKVHFCFLIFINNNFFLIS